MWECDEKSINLPVKLRIASKLGFILRIHAGTGLLVFFCTTENGYISIYQPTNLVEYSLVNIE